MLPRNLVIMYKLSSQEKACLNLASPTGIQKSAPSLLNNFGNDRWLNRGYIYYNDLVKNIRNNAQRGNLNSQDLREYIAVSILGHLIDGWEYLGQALYAQVRGEPIAIHLGYYAEMRATLSLLATQGIGVFNQDHCIIDTGGNAHLIPGRQLTHNAVWLYLEHWLNSRDADTLLGKIIRPRSIPLRKWINEMPCIRQGGQVLSASKMLYDFGVDLRRMNNDRDLRNAASYRPFYISSYRNRSFIKPIKYIFDTVRILEPSTTQGGFDILDQYLLCQTVENIFKSTPTLNNNPDELKRQISIMLTAVLEDDYLHQKVERFILGKVLSQRVPEFIRLSSGRGDYDGDPRPLLNRAIFLLRIATGATSDFMRSTNIGFQALKFWWSIRGWEIGLWQDINRPVQIADLWADVDSALEEIKDWINSEEQSAHSFYLKCARPLHETTNLGRFAIMGLVS